MKTVEYHVFKGAKALTATVAATAVSDQSDTVRGAVRLTFGSAHGFLAGADDNHPNEIYLSGFSGALSYLNGMHTIVAVPTSTTLDVSIRNGEFAAGTPAGTELASVAVKPGHEHQYHLAAYSVYLGSTPSAAETLQVIMDPDGTGNTNIPVDAISMSGKSSFARRTISNEFPVPQDGIIWVDWDNSDGVTWEVRVAIKR